LGKAAIVGASIGAVGAKPFLDGKSSEVAAQKGNTLTVTRAQKAFRWRSDVALQGYQATSPTIRHNSNFDESYIRTASPTTRKACRTTPTAKSSGRLTNNFCRRSEREAPPTLN
jgi:hypothetical protein